MRRGLVSIGIIGLCALLTACGATGPATSGGGGSASAPAATATPSIIPLSMNDTSSQATSVCGGVFGGSGSQQIVYKLSDTLFVEAIYGLSNASFQLSSNLPVAPWPLPADLGSAQLTQQLGGAANVNPDVTQDGGILLTVCNASAQPLTLSSAQVIVASFTPAAGAVDVWNDCDGVFVRPTGTTGAGCGGALMPDESMNATFAAGAGKYATAPATQVAANGNNGFGPLPVTLKPASSVMLLIGLTRPSALGTYEFGVAVTTNASGGAGTLSPYAPLPPQLFALVAHKFTGKACQAPTMQSQIPAQATNPATYYICPE